MGEIPTKEIKTATGFMHVSTPEATALDLVHFPSAVGHFNHMATVLFELAEQLDPKELRRLAENAPSVEVRRLGFLLDLIGAEKVAKPLRILARNRKARPLDPAGPQRGGERNDRWMLYVNTTVEPDDV
jgi:predicted transcriptional regulator of viral defense system